MDAAFVQLLGQGTSVQFSKILISVQSARREESIHMLSWKSQDLTKHQLPFLPYLMRINILKQRLMEISTKPVPKCSVLKELHITWVLHTMVDQDIMVLEMVTGKVEKIKSNVHLWLERRSMFLLEAKVSELMVNPNLQAQLILQLNHNQLELTLKMSQSLTKLLLREICKALWNLLLKHIQVTKTSKTRWKASSNTWSLSSRTAEDQMLVEVSVWILEIVDKTGEAMAVIGVVKTGVMDPTKTSHGESTEANLSLLQLKLSFATLANLLWPESKWETTLTGHISQDAFSEVISPESLPNLLKMFIFQSTPMFQKCPTFSWAFLWMSEITLCSLTRLSIMLISTFVAQEETLLVKRLPSSSRLLSKSTKMSSTELLSRSLTNSTPPKRANLLSRPSQPTMRAYLSLSLNL